MKTAIRAIIASAVLAACAAPQAETSAPLPPLASDADIAAAEAAPLADMAKTWNEDFTPFNVMGDIYFVGTSELGSWLITTPDGDILLDGAMPQSAPMIIRHIAALGFDIKDVKFLLNSHAHFDHQGGLAALQRASGATFVASAADRPILESGRIAWGPAASIPSPPIRVDRVIADGETVSLGGVTLTAHLTPGHTPGCTTWTMPVTGADGAPHTAVFFCSATVAGQSIAPESYPGMVADYRATFAKMRALNADVFLANHPTFFGMQAKRDRQIAGDSNAFVDPDGFHQFIANLETAFDAELARQQAAAH